MDTTEDYIDICRVCELVDRNVDKKPVMYCSVCDSLICDVCRPDLPKRAVAMALNVKQKTIEAVKLFFTKNK